jgi:hypothetical protein
MTSTPLSCRFWALAMSVLTYKHQGRYYRLTDVAGKVVKGILV